ncbi:MAG: tetratricopeptide repeat protein, partial [Anaerolineales bacterium]|nr:tetratricopeptide repeat protein [Anaerolineales bacterium]
IGLIEKSQAAFQHALDLQRRTGVNRRQMATALNNLGYLYNLTGQYRLAVPLLREALEIIRSLGKGGSDIFILNSWGEWLMDIGELDRAEEELLKAVRIGESLNEPHMLGQTNLLLAGLQSLKGDFNQAFHHLRESARIRGETEASEANQLMTAMIRLEMGQEELACEALENSLALNRNGDRATQQRATAMFLLAVIKYRLGDETAAKACLEKSLNSAAVLGYDQFLVVTGQRTPDFWRFAGKSLKGNAQLKSLLERVSSFKKGLEAYLEPEPEPDTEQAARLEVFGFGNERVVLNGSLIANNVWRAAKSREIFFYILDNQGSRSASIKLEFWPDRDPIRATSVFQSTLWRARQALGEGEIIVLDSDRYQIAPHVEVWYDVAEFERLVRQAASLSEKPRQRANILQQAVALYEGDFLNDVFSDWAGTRREQLRVQFLAALKDLADLEVEAGHLNKARTCYERIVEINPYHDDAHLAIADLLIQMGRPNAAREYCRKVVSFLHSEGLAPSIEFSNFIRELTG